MLLLVRANSGDSDILINYDKDLFVGWIISREISTFGKKLNLQVKSDHIAVIDSYTINQFDSNFGNLAVILFYFYTDHFHQGNIYNIQEAHNVSKFNTVAVGILLSH